MRRSTRTTVALILCAAPLLVGCGDSTIDTLPGTPQVGAEADGSKPVRDRTVRPPLPEEIKLPDAPPLGDTAAGSILVDLSADLAGDDLSRAVLTYLRDLGQTSGLEAARAQLLEETDGEFDDDEAAALGLETVLAHGNAKAAARILALAKDVIADEMEGPALAFALARIDGAERTAAEGLLAKIANGDDEEAAQIAIEELAKRRSNAAAAVLPGIVSDEERADSLRGSALAAMAAIRHPGLQTAADALLASGADLSDVILGLAVPGVTEAVEFIERAMTVAFDEGAADFEFAAACDALAVIYGSGEGSDGARAAIARWLTADPDMACDESIVALWKLGDEGQAPYAARVLAGEVARASYIDTEFAIEILEEIAKRGLARDPRFKKAVDAAAVATPDAGRPGANLNVDALRAAAAYAYLKSR